MLSKIFLNEKRKICFFLFFVVGHLYGESVFDELNTIQVYLNVRMQVFEDSEPVKVTLTLTESESAVGYNTLARITTVPKTVSMTLAQLQSAKKISVPIAITAKPDPRATNGYVVQLALLAQRVVLDQYSRYFTRFQNLQLSTEVPLKVTATPSAKVSASAVDITQNGAQMKQWYFLPQGVNLATTWDSQYFLMTQQVGKTLSSAVDFAVSVDQIIALQPGVYWFALIPLMSGLSTTLTSAELKAINDSQLESQLATLELFVSQIDAKLTGTTGLFQLTAAQRANLTANRTLLEKEIAEIEKILK